MTINTWGITWFDDLPVPSASEPFDINKARNDILQVNVICLIQPELCLEQR